MLTVSIELFVINLKREDIDISDEDLDAEVTSKIKASRLKPMKVVMRILKLKMTRT